MKAQNKWIIGSLIGLAIIGIANGNSQAPYSKTVTNFKIEESANRSVKNDEIEKNSSSTLQVNEAKGYQKPVPYETPADDNKINYYTNTYGNEVQSPTYYNSQPAGASALCRDGSYSFSQSRRGTCSHHGGVEEWL